jgi:hypothetical protein
MDERGVDNLLNFYRKKVREAPGGAFWKVFDGAKNHGTFWARNPRDLHNHLNRNEVKYTKLLKLQ